MWGRVISHNFDRHCYHYSLNRCLIGLKFAYWNVTTGFFFQYASAYIWVAESFILWKLCFNGECQIRQIDLAIFLMPTQYRYHAPSWFTAWLVFTSSSTLFHFMCICIFFVRVKHSIKNFVYIALYVQYFIFLNDHQYSYGLAYLKKTVHFFKHWCSLNNYFQALIAANLFLHRFIHVTYLQGDIKNLGNSLLCLCKF